MLLFHGVPARRTKQTVTARDYTELRDAVGAIGLAVSMLRLNESDWLTRVDAAQADRIRAILRALAAASTELADRVGPRQVVARRGHTTPAGSLVLAAEAAHAIEGGQALGSVCAPPTPALGVELAAALRRLEVLAAVAPPPRPQLAVSVESSISVPVAADALISALRQAVFGLVASRPVRRNPWTVRIGARSEAGQVAIELRCEVPDNAAGQGSGDAVLPMWLHECMRLTESCAGSVARHRDGNDELLRIVLPRCEAGALPTGPAEAAANEAPARTPRPDRAVA